MLKTVVVGAGVFLFTNTFVKVTLPELLTLPLKVRTPPRGVGVPGQASLTAMSAAPCTGQVAVELVVICVPVHLSRAVAVKVEAMAHPLFTGTE